MFIQIDFAAQTPVYEQVALQIKFAVAAGSLPIDELIPSVRELSKQLALNPNTVARAYRSLQDEGVVYARRGTGLAVAADAPEKCRRERKTWFENRFRKLYDEAVRSRLNEKELQEIITHLAGTPVPPIP
jgi:GntR family transcriptional regulator